MGMPPLMGPPPALGGFGAPPGMPMMMGHPMAMMGGPGGYGARPPPMAAGPFTGGPPACGPQAPPWMYLPQAGYFGMSSLSNQSCVEVLSKDVTGMPVGSCIFEIKSLSPPSGPDGTYAEVEFLGASDPNEAACLGGAFPPGSTHRGLLHFSSQDSQACEANHQTNYGVPPACRFVHHTDCFRGRDAHNPIIERWARRPVQRSSGLPPGVPLQQSPPSLPPTVLGTQTPAAAGVIVAGAASVGTGGRPAGTAPASSPLTAAGGVSPSPAAVALGVSVKNDH